MRILALRWLTSNDFNFRDKVHAHVMSQSDDVITWLLEIACLKEVSCCISIYLSHVRSDKLIKNSQNIQHVKLKTQYGK